MYRDRLSSVVCVPTLSRELHTLYMLVSILPDGSLLRSDRNRDRLGAGQPRRANTLRHRLLGRPRDFWSTAFRGSIPEQENDCPLTDSAKMKSKSGGFPWYSVDYIVMFDLGKEKELHLRTLTESSKKKSSRFEKN